MEVTTALALDGQTLNLLVAGDQAELLLTGVAHPGVKEDEEEDLTQLVSAYAIRELTGKKISLTPRETEKNNFHIQFKSSNHKSILERFTLAVLFRGQHIQGSPFLLQFVDQMGYNSALTRNGKEVSVDVQHRVNIVLPHKTAEKLGVEVRGPEGAGDTDISNWPGHAAAFAFTPYEAGEYKMHLSLNDKPVEKSPYSILADFSAAEAQQCYIMEDDLHLFDNPVLFGTDNPAFRVMTKIASLDDETPSSEKLSIVCSGPGKASVQIKKDADFPGTESCTVIPSTQGNYRLNILWKEKHIQQSPITMTFRNLKNVIACQGLEISTQSFKVGQPYSFKLNSSDVGNECLEVLCEPPSGADISLDPTNGDRNFYKCEVKPLKAGQHAISIKYLGEHIEGSPFKVHFEDAANAALCKMVEAARDGKTKGKVNVKISTEGAGPGIMEASVQLAGQNGTVNQDDVEITRYDTMYLFQFSLGESAACLFQASYNRNPIYGSPFKLVFGEMGKVRARGQGLAAGRVGEWNSFVLQAIGCNGVPGEQPQVTIRNQENQAAQVELLPVTLRSSLSPKNSQESLASTETSIDYEVKYLPEAAGKYKISISWGLMPVPGSPFLVDCFLPVFDVQNPPEKLLLGSTIELNIQNCHHSEASVELADFTVDAKSNKGESITGKITRPHLEESESGPVYKCTLLPEAAGKYIVGIKWKKLHIEGSPFYVRVVDPPRPDCVVVRGPGLQDGIIGQQDFVVETAAAGAGMLTMKVGRTLEDDKKERLPLQISRNEDNRRTLHASYHPTLPGEYVIEVQWAGTSVPGSPFKVQVHPHDKVLVVADIHAPDDVVEMNQWAEEMTEIDGESLVDPHLAKATTRLDSSQQSVSNHVELDLDYNSNAVVEINQWAEENTEIDRAVPVDPHLAEETTRQDSSEQSVSGRPNHVELDLDDNSNDVVEMNQWAEENTEIEVPVDPHLAKQTTRRDSSKHRQDSIEYVSISESPNHVELELDDNITNAVMEMNQWAEEKTEIGRKLPEDKETTKKGSSEHTSVLLPERATSEKTNHTELESDGNDETAISSDSGHTGTVILNDNYSGELD